MSSTFQHQDLHLIGESLSRQGTRATTPSYNDQTRTRDIEVQKPRVTLPISRPSESKSQQPFTFGHASEKRNQSLHWMVHQDPTPAPVPQRPATRDLRMVSSEAISNASVRSSLHEGVDSRPRDAHFAASGLGFGPGHRLHYRYVHKDWDPEVRQTFQ